MYKRILLVVIVFIHVVTLYPDTIVLKPVTFREIKRPYKTVSPYFKFLLSIKDQKKLHREVDLFWERAQKKGLPFIETDSNDPDYLYMTFVYRCRKKNWKISFEVFGIYDETRLGDLNLRHLADTDLYYRCYKVPTDICISYRFIEKDILSGKTRRHLDAFNPDRIPTGKKKELSYSVMDLNKSKTNFFSKLPNIPSGRIENFLFDDRVTNRERKIYVYLPPGYDQYRKKGYPTIYLFDSPIYLNRVEVPHIMDNLIANNDIEPMIAVMITSYKSTREKVLPLNFDFMKMFTTEIVPLIRSKYNCAVEPARNLIGGMSYGGLAASFIALHHPDMFGKVLSQSGSYWRGLALTDIEGNWIREDWLINHVIQSPPKKIRIFMDWGLQENWVLGANRRMIRVLHAKGYDYRFIEFNGWHDWSNSRKTFSKGLLFLLKE